MECGEQVTEELFKRAFDTGCLRAYYQPIVKTFEFEEELVAFEALARWITPDGSGRTTTLPAAIFIPWVTDHGHIKELDELMIHQVCQEQRKRFDEGLHMFPISVNISRSTLLEGGIVEFLKQEASEAGIPPQCICVEVTEGAAPSCQDDVKRTIRRIRENGFGVWLDDFGKASSNLDILKDCAFDLLKIDMQYLREYRKKRKSRIILNSILSMSEALQLPFLLEGVETHQERALADSLRRAYGKRDGCYLQGFYYGKPTASTRSLALW